MDTLGWALEQVRTRQRPFCLEEMAGPSIQSLIDSLATVRGGGNGQVFGLNRANLEAACLPRLEEAIVDALRGWVRHFEAAADVVSLLELDKVGKKFDLAELELSKRFPLKCDPLGSREGLSKEWRARFSRLDELKAGRRAADLKAIGWAGLDSWEDEEGKDVPPSLEVGGSQESVLYEFCLRYEAGHGKTFPRELAAFAATANGIFVKDDPVVRPVSLWSWEDRGLCIGCGGYLQGSLTIEQTAKKGLLRSKVVDRDDDGVVLRRYADFGAFLDALLG